MHVYIFAYSRFMGNTDEVRELLEQVDCIEKICQLLQGTFLLLSEAEATDLHAKIKKIAPNKRFLISEISENRQGWLPKRIWQFIRQVDD